MILEIPGLQQLFIPRKPVDMGFRIAHSPGISIPIPHAADIPRPIYNFGAEAGFAGKIQLVNSTEPCDLVSEAL